MKKTVYLLVFVLLLAALFSLSVCAETAVAEDIEGQSNAPLSTNGEEEMGRTAFTEAVSDFWNAHAEKVLCALAFIASLVPTLLYKTGLVPLLRAGLSALCDASGKAGKQAEEFSSLAEEKLSVLKEGAEAAVLASQSALSVLSETEKRLAALETALEESVREKKKTTAALQTETELLFRMLQCVNLPQAQKDLMSERYLALQKTLEEN